jgi:hypothetical protein
MITATAPAGYATEDEFPIREIPDIPLWSENYCYAAFDAQGRVGVWTHLGRAPFDPTVWRELVIVLLPDDQLLVSKSFACHPIETGPGAAAMEFVCEDPWNRWTSRFHGAAIPTDRASLGDSLVTDVVKTGLSFDLSWEAHSPIWEMGEEMRKQSWGHLHYEQLCRVTGRVAYGDTELVLDGHGLRDHTRGPRDFGPVERHCWIYGVFPSGRGFVLLDVTAGPRMSRAMVLGEDGSMVEAKVRTAPLLASRAGGDDSYTLDFDWESGSAHIEAEILANCPCAFGLPSEVLFGYDPAHTSHALFEGMARLTWDGEEGYGLTERTVRNP